MIDIEGFRNYLYEEELSKNTIDAYIRGVKIYAEKFEAVDPYTAYFVIADGKVYRVESTMSLLTDMVATLKGERPL